MNNVDCCSYHHHPRWWLFLSFLLNIYFINKSTMENMILVFVIFQLLFFSSPSSSLVQKMSEALDYNTHIRQSISKIRGKIMICLTACVLFTLSGMEYLYTKCNPILYFLSLFPSKFLLSLLSNFWINLIPFLIVNLYRLVDRSSFFRS